MEKKCTNCWLCKEICPVYKALKNEAVSPRAKNNIYEKIINKEIEIDSDFFFNFCNWCRACEVVCPIWFWFDVVKVREELLQMWYIKEENKKMIENIKKYRNPFGKIDYNSKQPPDKLYCC